MPWASFILSCHFEEFDYSQNVLLVLSLRLIQGHVIFRAKVSPAKVILRGRKLAQQMALISLISGIS